MLNSISNDQRLCVAEQRKEGYVNTLCISMLTPPLPHRYRGCVPLIRSRSMRVCEAVCVYGGGTPLWHGRPGAGWSGASMVTYGYQATNIQRETVFVSSL